MEFTTLAASVEKPNAFPTHPNGTQMTQNKP